MNIRGVMWCGTASLFLAGAAGAQTIHRSVAAVSAGEVQISLTEGDVTVTGWDRAQVEISGELGEDAERLEVTQDGESTLIRVISQGDGSDGGFRGEAEIYVRVPRDSSLEVVTVSADILVSEVNGAQTLRSVSGEVETEFRSEIIEAETVGGDLVISSRREPGNAVVTSVSGDVEVRGPFDTLIASTVSGDIELDILDASLLDLSTTNGDIEVHATLRDGAELAAETINGDVELDVGDEGNLNLDIGSFSGRIENCFGYETTISNQGSGRELRIDASEDSPRIRVRTLNGDIEVCSS